ncbi:multicopper oxidase domain-containing protein [Ramlibacter alkalitolerans]|uniref:Multicopper oxidase domain-containing protein n=1 Tax=Ramlibacter alkalitolerans TaxID=2039631 RepID=A0ABS1JIR0_9BURK|nr:multicopper oxidase domain-containing protein [Ramlibacter alkalitolerans]
MNVSLASDDVDTFEEPPPTDPGYYRPQSDNPVLSIDALKLAPTPVYGSMEVPGGSYLTKEEVNSGGALAPVDLTSRNYPSNGFPSSLFGATPWTQKLLMFEEFGTERLDPNQQAGTLPFPQPRKGPAPQQDPGNVARSGPDSAELDAFLAQTGLHPFPTRQANTSWSNPWKPEVELFLDRFLAEAPAEGRPPGEGWAHQRWNEFYPQAYFKTVQAGARTNNGVRDARQMHEYKVGEFGPGGLYYNTADDTNPQFDGTTRGIPVRIHPKMPVQDHKSVWTFDGTFPPKLLMVRYGQPVLMRHYNGLPIDPAANHGFGLHTITTHEHNGHNPAESDGFANAFFFPGQFYDYRWPIQLAGYDSINTAATDSRAAFPCAPGETLWVNDMTASRKTCDQGRINIRGDWRETMSTHWFHDHMFDFTAQNVYKGNAAMMNYYSALDRGNEAIADGVSLRLPSGSALPWGNRDYDVNLLIADKAWDRQGQLWFNPFNLDGFIGDRVLVNWQWAPVLDVRARRYRFRILNGSVSRFFEFALVAECTGETTCPMPGPVGSGKSYQRAPFHMVANDGNVMEHAVPFDGTMDLDHDGDAAEHNGVLPLQGIAERYDIVVDFSKYAAGTRLYLVNLLEHDTGVGVNATVALESVLNETYKAVIERKDGVDRRWRDGDPGVGLVMQMVVQPYAGLDASMNPADYEPAKPGKAAGKKMVPLWLDRSDPAMLAKLANARHRAFHFGRNTGTDESPWTIQTDEGLAYTADIRRIDAAAQLANGPTPGGYEGQGTLEVWELKTGGGWSHPVHVHFEEGIILQRGGMEPPEWEKWARKDVYRIGSEDASTRSVQLAIHFREFAGTYMEHCHNTQHEDNSMLLRWDIERPGQFLLMPTPLPSWEGVEYVASVGVPTFRSGSAGGPPVVVPPPNDPPLAGSASTGAVAARPVTMNLLTGATDPDGNNTVHHAEITDWPVALGPKPSPVNGLLSFVPPRVGNFSFGYRVVDDAGVPSTNVGKGSVAAVASEALAFLRANYTRKFGIWAVVGTDRVHAGQTIVVTYANGTFAKGPFAGRSCDGTATIPDCVVGTVLLGASNTWSLNLRLGSGGAKDPGNSDGTWSTRPTSLRASSTAPDLGGSATFPINFVDDADVPPTNVGGGSGAAVAEEAIALVRANYTPKFGIWTVVGTDRVHAGQTIVVAYTSGTFAKGPSAGRSCDGTATVPDCVVGTVVLGASNTWSVNLRLGSGGAKDPSNSDGTWSTPPASVRAFSSSPDLGGSATLPITLIH